MLDPAALAVLRQLKPQEEEKKVRKEGFVKATDKSYGFLEVSSDERYFISPPDMKKVMHGDRIAANIKTAPDGKQSAEPIELINAFITRIPGKLTVRKDGTYATYVDHPNYKNPIFTKIPNTLREQNPGNGDWVIVELSDHPLVKDNKPASLIVKEVVTKANDPQVPWKVSLRKHNLPLDCPPDPDKIEPVDADARRDLRHMPFITIDSEDTKDIDDAVCIEKSENGWILTVAIADPTSFIEEGSPTDKEASSRGFTCYLPGYNIPIIPHSMSEGICSLFEGEDRPTLACRIHVGFDGVPSDTPCEFFLADIKSQGRLSYKNVSDFLEGAEGCQFHPSEAIAEELRELEKFQHARAAHRAKTTVLFADKPDYKFVLGSNGKLENIVAVSRRIADKIIEEAMILSNETAGKFLSDHLGFGVFSRHTGFDETKRDMAARHLSLNGCSDIQAADLATLDGYFRARTYAASLESQYLDVRLRKFQVPAEIVTDPLEHFGLGLSRYATWTSPIRKYGDMINHRLIKSVIRNDGKAQRPSEEVIANLNVCKKTSRIVERDVRDWLYIDFLMPQIKLKTIFEAEVVDVSRGGVKAKIDENGATVFIPMSVINPDRKESIVASQDEGRIRNGEEIIFELSQKIKVRITDIDRENRQILAEVAKA